MQLTNIVRKRSCSAIVDIATRLNDGVGFVIQSICSEADQTNPKTWRWWHGRLCMVERLMEDFRNQFSPKASHILESCDHKPVTPEVATQQLGAVRSFATTAGHVRHHQYAPINHRY